MSLLYLAGQKLNLLARAASITNTVGGDDALYPPSGLYDDYPDVPYRFNSLVADCAFKMDLDLFGGTGAFTTWGGGAASGWTNQVTGTGSVTQLSPGKDGTGSAVRLNGGASGTAAVFKMVTVRAGEFVKLDDLLAVQIAAGGTIGLTIYNNSTRNYWTGSVWSATPTNFIAQGPTAWVTKPTSAFQIEAFGGANPPLPVLTFTFITASNANCDVDDVYFYPGASFAAVFGHNLDSVTPELHKSTDNFAANSVTVATFTITRPAFYVSFAITYSRWWRFKYTGTNQNRIYLGEVVLGQGVTILRDPDIRFGTDNTFPQFRYKSVGKRQNIANITTDEVRDLRLTFRNSESDLAELKGEWFRRSFGGLYPMIVVPMPTETTVHHGRLVQDPFTHERAFLDLEDVSVTIEGSAFPTFVG